MGKMPKIAFKVISEISALHWQLCCSVLLHADKIIVLN
jgi:hypothetical protein